MYDFNEIVGNEQIIKSMKSAVRHSMVSHAYIIGGADGCGKGLIAAAFAKTLLCEGGGDIRVAARITELVSALLDLPSNRICVEQRKG